MRIRLLFLFLSLLVLTACGLAKKINSTNVAIDQNREVVTESTQAIHQNLELVNNSTAVLQQNSKAVQESTLIIKENARTIQDSTALLSENIKLLESASGLIPKAEHSQWLLVLGIAILLFLFGLPLIISMHLARISRKLTKIEKELKK